MCLSGVMYLDEDQYEAEKKFYNKGEENWDYYSGLPSPRAYESDE
tara:strand:- start:179 stop:313 length:135 start_codon:yes stop_codon:yes gene_type:complete